MMEGLCDLTKDLKRLVAAAFSQQKNVNPRHDHFFALLWGIANDLMDDDLKEWQSKW